MMREAKDKSNTQTAIASLQLPARAYPVSYIQSASTQVGPWTHPCVPSPLPLGAGQLSLPSTGFAASGAHSAHLNNSDMFLGHTTEGGD